MLFLSVRGFLDYAGPSNPLAITWLLCCLPPLGRESASCSIGFSKLNSPAHRYLCLRFKRYLAISPARLEARIDSLLSFPVGLFHPLQHAGLSRRSPACRPLAQNASFLAFHTPNLDSWLLAQNLVSVLRRTGSADSAEHSRSSCAERPGCSKAAKWSPFFSSLSPLRRAFGRRLLQGRL